MHQTDRTPSAPAPPDHDDYSGGALVIGPRRAWPVPVVVVLVLLLAEALVRVGTAGLPPPLRWYDAATEHRVQMMRDRGTADVVFAGTSMAWQGLVPSVFTAADPHGRSAFNAGLAGAVPAVTGPWLTSYVVPSLMPRTLVWGLSTLDFAPAYGDQQVRAWTSSLEGRQGALGSLERSLASVSALVAHRAQLRRPNEIFGAGRDALAADRAEAIATTGPDGERVVFDATRTDEGAAVQQARLAGFATDREDVAAVVRTVLELKALGVEVVLAELPVSPSFVALHPHGQADVDVTRRAVSILAEELGVRYLPATGSFTDADFVDYNHLTRDAATRFTQSVAQQLAIPPGGGGPEAG